MKTKDEKSGDRRRRDDDEGGFGGNADSNDAEAA
jgi:hypothetical protein